MSSPRSSSRSPSSTPSEARTPAASPQRSPHIDSKRLLASLAAQRTSYRPAYDKGKAREVAAEEPILSRSRRARSSRRSLTAPVSPAYSSDDDDQPTSSRSRTTTHPSVLRPMRTPTLLRASRRKAHLSSPSSPQLAATQATSSSSSTVVLDAATSNASLYHLSRGRSANVSPNRRWDRRAASASVLSGASASGSGGDDSELTEMADGDARPKRIAKGGLQPSSRLSVVASPSDALFSDDEGDAISPSEGEEDGTSRIASSRRSSTDRGRRRGLRVLLAPATPSRAEASRPAEANTSGPDSTTSGSGTTSAPCPHSCGTSLTTLSDEQRSDRLSTSSCSSTSDILEFKASDRPSRRTSDDHDYGQMPNPIGLEADDEGGALGTSALLIRRRSREGRKPLRSPSRVRLSGFSAINPSLTSVVASVTDDGSEASTPASIEALVRARARARYRSTSPQVLARASAHSLRSSGSSSLSPPSVSPADAAAQAVSSDSDPLTGTSPRCVEDMIHVDEVVWGDEDGVQKPPQPRSSASEALRAAAQKGKGERRLSTVSSSTSSSSALRRDSIVDGGSDAEQESARRSGFAAAYQARLMSLGSHLRLWDRRPPTELAAADAPVAATETPSIFYSSWRHISALPNLILMPALGTRQAAGEVPPVVAPLPAAMPSPPSPANAVIPLPSDDSSSPVTATPLPSDAASVLATPLSPTAALPRRSVSETSERRPRGGRGIVSPLEGDLDTGAYISGLGMPIDPDTELSAVVHLQTFRTRATRSQSQSGVAREARPKKGLRSRSASRGRIEVKEDAAAKPTANATRRHSTESDQRSTRRGALMADLRMEPMPKPPAREEKPAVLVTPATPSSDAPRCSRPAVAEFVPGDFSAYGSASSNSDSNDSGEDRARAPRTRSRTSVRVVRDESESRSPSPTASLRSSTRGDSRPVSPHLSATRSMGRASGRSMRRGRERSPERDARQCAIGLFSASSRRESLEDVRVPRVRSSPNLSYFGRTRRGSTDSSDLPTSRHALRATATVATPAVDIPNAHRRPDADDNERSGTSSGENDTTDEDSDDGGRGGRGRAGEVKLVSASIENTADAGVGKLSNSTLRSPSAPPAPDMGVSGALPAANGGVGFSSGGAPFVAASRGSFRRPGIPGSAVGPRAPSPAPGSSRPSLVSNGAHLLMLSLELEMMRCQKITTSLRPRWLKARLRTEPLHPRDDDEEAIAEQRRSVALGSAFGGKEAMASRPRPGSLLRFEIAPTIEDGSGSLLS